MSIIESTSAPELTHEEALRQVSKLRRENARLRLYIKDLEAAAGMESTVHLQGLRALRGMLRHLQQQAMERLDMIADTGLLGDDEEA